MASPFNLLPQLPSSLGELTSGNPLVGTAPTEELLPEGTPPFADLLGKVISGDNPSPNGSNVLGLSESPYLSTEKPSGNLLQNVWNKLMPGFSKQAASVSAEPTEEPVELLAFSTETDGIKSGEDIESLESDLTIFPPEDQKSDDKQKDVAQAASLLGSLQAIFFPQKIEEPAPTTPKVEIGEEFPSEQPTANQIFNSNSFVSPPARKIDQAIFSEVRPIQTSDVETSQRPKTVEESFQYFQSSDTSTPEPVNSGQPSIEGSVSGQLSKNTVETIQAPSKLIQQFTQLGLPSGESIKVTVSQDREYSPKKPALQSPSFFPGLSAVPTKDGEVPLTKPSNQQVDQQTTESKVPNSQEKLLPNTSKAVDQSSFSHYLANEKSRTKEVQIKDPEEKLVQEKINPDEAAEILSTNTFSVTKPVESSTSVQPTTGGETLQGVTGPSTPSASLKGLTENTPPSQTFTTHQSLADQAVKGATLGIHSGQKEMSIQLNPEHLGQLRINLTSTEENQVSARLVANTRKAYDELKTSIHSLKSALEAQGIQVGHVSVVMAGESSSSSGLGGGGRQEDPSSNNQNFFQQVAQEQFSQQQSAYSNGQNSQEFAQNRFQSSPFQRETQLSQREETVERSSRRNVFNNDGRISLLA